MRESGRARAQSAGTSRCVERMSRKSAGKSYGLDGRDQGESKRAREELLWASCGLNILDSFVLLKWDCDVS